MIVDINYEDTIWATRLVANDYSKRHAAEREAILLGLRHRYRSVRRVLVTFASGKRYIDRQRTFTASAAATGEFHTLENWTFDRIRATQFFDHHRAILQHAKGQGYWLWKPYIIWRALEESKDGDLIVYNDSLPEAGNVLTRSILPMLSWLSGGTRRIAIARKPPLNRTWTKRDCFHFMECDSPIFWDQEQVIATYMAFLAGPATRTLVADWLRFCSDPRVLTDKPNTCGLENFPGFQDHRHDQSVLSNLLIRDEFELPDILFGREITTKQMQDMLGVFEDKLINFCVNISKSEINNTCISLGKPWTQSSPSHWSRTTGVMTEKASNQDFFFHTDVEENPWWILDLQAHHMVERIEIENRPDVFGWRANRLQVWGGIHLDGLDLIYDAVSENWDAEIPLALHAGNRILRYVKIGVDNMAALHLKDVRVYGRAL